MKVHLDVGKDFFSPSNTTGTTSGIPWIFHDFPRIPQVSRDPKIIQKL